MSIISSKTTGTILKNFDLFAQLLENFPDNKKQIKYIRKMISSYCVDINEENYLLTESDRAQVNCFVNQIKESAVFLYKSKSVYDYNRGKQELARCRADLLSAISKIELKLAEEKGKSVIGGVVDKAKSIGNIINKGVDKIKNAANKAKEELE